MLASLGIALAVLILASPAMTSERTQPGILVMAHGGDTDWNRAVEAAVEPLRRFCPTRIAYGMADRDSLQEGLDALWQQGAGRVAVVRLFVSADSFKDQTEYFLGLRSQPPPFFLLHPGHRPGMPLVEKPQPGAPNYPVLVSSRDRQIPPVKTAVRVSLNREGLYDSSLIAAIVVERVLDLSLDAGRESVLILAHGEGDDRLNDRWRKGLQRVALKVRQSRPFRRVEVETLREDWQSKRIVAEERIRNFIRQQKAQGSRVIVVPFRVYGFGPYAEVLKGLDYVSDQKGLLPHPGVTEWLQQQAIDCFVREGWTNPLTKTSQSR